jgi:hypothetical protein
MEKVLSHVISSLNLNAMLGCPTLELTAFSPRPGQARENVWVKLDLLHEHRALVVCAD